MPPAIKKAGFTAVQPQLYQPGSEDYTQQISAFKKAGCDIQFGVANAPDFANFWKQCLQQGYNPKLMGCAKALVQPEELNALGDIGIGLYTSAGWHPSWPFKDSLTGMTCQEISDEYEQITGREWATVIQEYPRFEWAVDVLKRAKDMDSAEALLAAVVTTKMETIIGPLDPTSPVKMGTDHPVPNVYRPQYAGGQWRKGTKWPYELYVMSNAGAPLVTVQSKIQPMVYSS